MNSFFLRLGVAALFISISIGCGREQADMRNADQPTTVSESVPTMNASGLDLEGLSDADREAVLAQRICPVSGEPLGSMGTPLKVTVDGRSFFICCAACEDAAKANFDEYYAKIGAPTP